MDLGARIRAARRTRGLTQEELARRAGVSLNGVRALEQGGRTDPHFSTLSHLAGALDTSISELVGESSEHQRPKAQAPPSSVTPEMSDEERRNATAPTPVDRFLEESRAFVEEAKDDPWSAREKMPTLASSYVSAKRYRDRITDVKEMIAASDKVDEGLRLRTRAVFLIMSGPAGRDLRFVELDKETQETETKLLAEVR